MFAKPRSTPGSQDASGEPVTQTVGGGTRNDPLFPSENSNPTEDFQAPLPQPSAQAEPPLTPLVPQNNIILTQQERVNLYVYVPPTIVNKTAVLEIVDLNSQETVFMEFFEFESTETITRLVLPNTITFETTHPSDQRYQWRLYAYFAQHSTAQLLTEGWINRVEPSQESSSVLWHENLELWFAQREDSPTVWQQGLATETLERYADYPVQTYMFGVSEHSQAAGES
ncbi:MAG: DUF928 domain-containing protein [Spirulina sp. SIO3F2]|nr:DUF928 domain-containing protein [Spirulina sp. SIO3F2]